MKTLRRAIVPVLACAVAVPAVSGCGAEDVAQVGLAEAASKTAKARVAHLEGTIRATGMGMPIGLTLKLSGTTALDRPEADIRLDLAPLAALAGLPASAGKPRLVLVGGRLYGQVPRQFREHVPGRREWVAVKLAPLARALGLDARVVAKTMRVDLESQLQVLRAKGLLKKAGTDELDGVKVTRYRGRVRAQDTLFGLSAAERRKLQRSLDRLAGDDGDVPMPYEVWVGEDGLVRRVMCEARMPAEKGMPGGAIKMTFDLSDFGKPAPVTAPPAADVSDLTDRVAGLLREASRSGHIAIG